jgi:drug/metabolite transporter (DMT)-like permease
MPGSRPQQLVVNRYSLGGICAILLWSTTVALARSLAEQLGPLSAASSVYLTGGAVCIAYLGSSSTRFARLKQLPIRYVLGCGLLFLTYMLTLYLAIGGAVDRQQAIEVGLINYLWPASTILLSLLLLQKSARLSLLPGTLLALLGVYVVLSQGASASWTTLLANVQTNPSAYALALCAALSWGLYSNLVRRWGECEDCGAVTLFIPATGLALVLLRCVSGEDSSWQVRTIVEVLFMGAATTLGYVLWDGAMRKGDVVLVAACSYLTPLLSVLFSSAYLNLKPDRSVWLGCLFIVIGSLVSWASVSDETGRSDHVGTTIR